MTLEVTYYKDVSPQFTSSDVLGASLLSRLLNDAVESEDRLNLNVYTPTLKGTGQELLLVMFYIHGGGASQSPVVCAIRIWALHQRHRLEQSHQHSLQVSTGFLQHLGVVLLLMGCASNDLVCARSKSIGDLMDAQVKANAMMVTQQNWTTTFLVDRPTVDHDLIPGDFFEPVKTGKHNTKANIMWARPRMRLVDSS